MIAQALKHARLATIVVSLVLPLILIAIPVIRLHFDQYQDRIPALVTLVTMTQEWLCVLPAIQPAGPVQARWPSTA